MFSGLCSLHYWPGTKTFWIYTVSTPYRIHSQRGWEYLERTSNLPQSLTRKEWRRWQEGSPPAFGFVHLSVLFSHADRALQLSTFLMSLKLLKHGACTEPCAQDAHPLGDSKVHKSVSVLGWGNPWKFQIHFEINYK